MNINDTADTVNWYGPEKSKLYITDIRVAAHCTKSVTDRTTPN